MEQKNRFSPDSTYQSGLKKLSETAQLPEFLSFYAGYANTMRLENIILLWEQKTAVPEEYHTLEEWNTQDRKVIYGEASHLRLYAPENYHGKTETYDGKSMIALFHEKQTVYSDKFHRDTAEHPFVLTAKKVPEPTDEMLLHSCVSTALSCMQAMKCGMPLFEESGNYVTLDDPVRYDPGSNRLYIAKGASYDTVAYGLLRETLSCKRYQPNQKYQVYETNRFEASCAAQVILHQVGVTKSFPISLPSNAVSEQEIEHCIASIPSGIQVMRKDYEWIQGRLQEEQAAQASAPAKDEMQTDSDRNENLRNTGEEVSKENPVSDASRNWDEALNFQDLQNIASAGRQSGNEIGI